MLGNKIVLIAT